MNADRAEETAVALAEAWQALLAVHPEAWTVYENGLSAFATGIPPAGLNGVSCSRLDPDPEEVRRLLRELKARGLPTCSSSGRGPAQPCWRWRTRRASPLTSASR